MLRGLFFLLLIASSSPQAGEVYRWINEQGGVQYSDQPPPPTARQSAKITGKGNVIDVDKESYEARLARDKNPVLLYSSSCGPLCDQARDHLNRRGIPFTLRDPSTEPEIAVELKKLAGAVEVPVIVVGKTHQKGFEPGSWDSLLDSAGYPKTPLPSAKRKPAKQP